MSEPVELYERFDPIFFGRTERSLEECMAQAKKPAGAYRALLAEFRPLLNDTLKSQEPEGLGITFYKSLNSLCENEKTHVETLQKDWQKRCPAELREMYETAGGGAKKTKWYDCSEVSNHLERLAFPAEYAGLRLNFVLRDQVLQYGFCKRFADDLVRYWAVREPPRGIKDDILKAIALEGDPVFQFWTLAPYVHVDLCDAGLEPMKSMQRIISSAIRPRPIQSNDFKRANKGYGIAEGFKYLFLAPFGLKEIAEPLGLDERMPTHLRARLIAKVISRDL